jgi:hypothetical protein
VHELEQQGEMLALKLDETGLLSLLQPVPEFGLNWVNGPLTKGHPYHSQERLLDQAAEFIRNRPLGTPIVCLFQGLVAGVVIPRWNRTW